MLYLGLAHLPAAERAQRHPPSGAKPESTCASLLWKQFEQRSSTSMRFQTIDRRLITILLVVFVGIVGAALILPILPLYAQRQYHMSPVTITLLNSSFFAAQFLAGPYLGRLSDRIGRLPVLIVSQIGTALSFVMLAFAPSVAWLFAARILDGITGGNIIVARAYVTDITPREQRTRRWAISLPSLAWALSLARHWGACSRRPMDSACPISSPRLRQC
ncbi:MAG: MFS transporter [Caldilineaceae bacterium]